MKIKYSIIVARPDDEVLGCGHPFINGQSKAIPLMCASTVFGSKSKCVPNDKESVDDTHVALAYIGVNKEYEGNLRRQSV